MPPKTTTWFVTLAAIALLSGVARAQAIEPLESIEIEDDYDVPPEPPRTGIAVSIGLGIGNFRCPSAGCGAVTQAAGLQGHLGYMLTPRLEMLAEGWVMGHSDEAFTVTHTLVTLGLQAWLTQALWIRGGAGAAHSSFKQRGEIESRHSRSVPGLTLAVGVETLTRADFAIDLVVRGGTGFYDDAESRVHSMMFGVAASWY